MMAIILHIKADTHPEVVCAIRPPVAVHHDATVVPKVPATG